MPQGSLGIPQNEVARALSLHGFGNNDATWTGYTNVWVFAGECDIAVVMISTEIKSYVDGPNGDKFFEFIPHRRRGMNTNKFYNLIGNAVDQIYVGIFSVEDCNDIQSMRPVSATIRAALLLEPRQLVFGKF